MEISNIVGQSNIFKCSTDDPRWDADFVAQITDYHRLVDIKKRYELDKRIKPLSAVQMAITRTEMRCVYAKKDPCWGYIEGKGVRSRCIEGKCPRIKQCNSEYAKEEAAYWIMNEEERVLYGEPSKQKKYYLVDLVSDEEKEKYISDPKGAGIEFPPIKDEEKKTEPLKQKGRQLVIIGYEETYFGDADNQLSPIWGYVDDPEEKESLVTTKFGSRKEHVRRNAVKLEESRSFKKQDKKNGSFKVDKKKNSDKIVECKKSIDKQKYKQILDRKVSAYNLIELTEEKLTHISIGAKINILLANDAEVAFVSSAFLENKISHDIEKSNGSSSICLWSLQNQKFVADSGVIFISNGFLEKECDISNQSIWDELLKIKEFQELVISGREFFDFECEKEIKRWGCRNLYGATHIVVQLEDLDLSDEISCEQKILLARDVKSYLILSATTEEKLGTTTEEMWQALSRLMDMNEICEFPKVIKNLVLVPEKDGVGIKGIGHMIFEEY